MQTIALFFLISFVFSILIPIQTYIGLPLSECLRPEPDNSFEEQKNWLEELDNRKQPRPAGQPSNANHRCEKKGEEETLPLWPIWQTIDSREGGGAGAGRRSFWKKKPLSAMLLRFLSIAAVGKLFAAFATFFLILFPSPNTKNSPF